MKPADALLRLVVALLPRRRYEWGRAMRAELAALDSESARLSFAVSCLRATLSQPSPRAVGRLVVGALAVGGGIALTGATGYLPLRLALIAYVVLLVAIVWAGRLPSLAVIDRRASFVRLGGVVLVGLFAAGVVAGLRTGGNQFDRATIGVPIMAAISVSYLVAILLMTAGHSNEGVTVGAAIGLGAGVLWIAVVLLLPPVPAGVSAALLAIAVAAVFAAAISNRRARTAAGAQIAATRAAATALTAAATCALVINVAVALIGRVAPVRFIPLFAAGDGSLSQAARTAQSRTELADPYVAVLVIGALAALVLAVTVLAARRSDTSRPAVDAEPVAA